MRRDNDARMNGSAGTMLHFITSVFIIYRILQLRVRYFAGQSHETKLSAKDPVAEWKKATEQK